MTDTGHEDFQSESRACRSVADVAERLMEKYEPVLPLAVISTTVCTIARTFGRTPTSMMLADTVFAASDRHLARIAATS